MANAFRTLSLGLGGFKKEQLAEHAAVFNKGGSNPDSSTSQRNDLRNVAKTQAKAVIPDELDFFGTNAKPSSSRHRLDDTRNDADETSGSKASSKKRKREGKAASNGLEALDAIEGQSSAVSPPRPLDAASLKTFLRKHRLNLTGTDSPQPLMSWSEAHSRYSVPMWIANELEGKRAWDLTPVQRAALPVSLEKRDLLAMAPTGSGKTLAYLVPLLHHILAAQSVDAKAQKGTGPRALILSPTRELATQIYDETRRLLQASPEGQREAEQHARALASASAGSGSSQTLSKKARKGQVGGLRVALLTGGERIRPLEEANGSNGAAAAAAAGGRGAKFDIVISTPLRLAKAVESEGWQLSGVTQVVLDEADTLLGDAFLKQTDLLLSLCTSPHLQRSLFSATLPSSVEALSKTFLSPDACRLIVGNKDASSEDVEQELRFVGAEEGKLVELRTMLKTGQVKPPTLLFVQSIERCKDLYSELAYDGLRVEAIHSERSRTQREEVISRFKRGDVWLLLCTEVLSRGLDFKGVQVVINYDFPQSVESYVHRVGRTGRAGRKGKAVTFFTKEDAPYLRSVVNLIKQQQSSSSSSRQQEQQEMLARIPQYLLELPKQSKKKRKELKRKAPTRQGVAEASGSRMIEVDREERRTGKRVYVKEGAKSSGRGKGDKTAGKSSQRRNEAQSTDADA